MLVDRYGEAVEADLADRGWHLGRLLDECEFRFVLNVVDHLPRHSAYVQALSDDDEWAERVIDNPQPERGPSVRMADWSPELEMLTNLFDAVRELTRVTAMSAGAKPKKVNPAPRPRTALDRVRARRRKAQHNRLVTILLPDAEQGSQPS